MTQEQIDEWRAKLENPLHGNAMPNSVALQLLEQLESFQDDEVITECIIEENDELGNVLGELEGRFDSVIDGVKHAISVLSEKFPEENLAAREVRHHLMGTITDNDGNAYITELDRLQEENAKLHERLEVAMKVISAAAIPLEAIHASVQWELSPELKEAVTDGVKAIREAIAIASLKKEVR